MKVKEHMNLLGHKCKDRVTGFSGVIASVSFDLYGCIQALVNPGTDKDGKLLEQMWFDVNRLKITSKTPVMEIPNFEYGDVADAKKGPADKPRASKA